MLALQRLSPASQSSFSYLMVSDNVIETSYSRLSRLISLSDDSTPVDAGKRAVIFDMLQGVQQTTIGEGTHFKIPYIQVSRAEPIAPRHSQTSDLTFYCAYPPCQRPIIMDIRARPRIINSSTGTKDLQMVIAP